MLFYCRSDLDNPVDIINTGIQVNITQNAIPPSINGIICCKEVKPEYFIKRVTIFSCMKILNSVLTF